MKPKLKNYLYRENRYVKYPFGKKVVISEIRKNLCLQNFNSIIIIKNFNNEENIQSASNKNNYCRMQ